MFFAIREWIKEAENNGRENKRANLFRALFRYFGIRFFMYGLLPFIEECILKYK